jgi:uncharacterized membrane protein HdeD (DUF308 family)
MPAMAALPPEPDLSDLLRSVSRLWWLYLITGILLLVLGFVVLSYDARSLAMTSILIGVSFLVAGMGWLVTGLTMDEGKGWVITGGILGLVAGIVAFVYPGETLLALALIVGWYLLVAGIVEIVQSFLHRERDLWWLGLITGVVMLGLGAWAVREDDRSVLLLVTIVGVFCVLRGIRDLITAFALRHVRKELA